MSGLCIQFSRRALLILLLVLCYASTSFHIFQRTAIFTEEVAEGPLMGFTDNGDVTNLKKKKKKRKTQSNRHPNPTFALLRSIGNALPPRHSPEQTIRNLKFTLSNEEAFPLVIKHWVLNRIVDKTVETRLLEVLQSHRQNYTLIPFNLTEYSAMDYAWSIAGMKDVVHSHSFERANRVMNHRRPILIALEAFEMHKNNYAMHVNLARNAMIDIGQSYHTDWIMPWDGNIFLTRAAFQEIRSHIIADQQDVRYILTPMHRVVGSNEAFFANLSDKEDFSAANQEPQIMFRNDATARFNPNLWYSRRDKVELLFRLGFSDGFLGQKWLEWEKKYLDIMKPIQDKPRHLPTVGGVYRLDSGRKDLEAANTSVSTDMMVARYIGVTEFLERLDERVARELHHFNSSEVVYMNRPDALLDFDQVSDHSISCSDPSKAADIVAHSTLLYARSGQVEWADRAVACLRSCLGQKPKHAFKALFTTNTMPHLLDAIRMLLRYQKLTSSDHNNIHKFFTAYLKWLETSTPGKESYMACGYKGLLYDIHVVSVAGWLDDVRAMLWYLDRSKSRLLWVVDNGRLDDSCHDTGSPLQILREWFILSSLAQAHHRNFWVAYPNKAGNSPLCRLVAYYMNASIGENKGLFRLLQKAVTMNCPNMPPSTLVE